jgi:hypothetical protein
MRPSPKSKMQTLHIKTIWLKPLTTDQLNKSPIINN